MYVHGGKYDSHCVFNPLFFYCITKKNKFPSVARLNSTSYLRTYCIALYHARSLTGDHFDDIPEP